MIKLENKKTPGPRKITIVEVPYKILKEYFAAQNENYKEEVKK